MAHIQLDYFSQVLKRETHLQIIHPTPGPSVSGPYPVLYLLHGLMVDETAWLRYSMLEEYLRDKKLIVVMPNGGRSYYLKQKNGEDYSRFLTKEIPQLIKSMFDISEKRADTFIAGMSMGGYGALHAGLSHTKKYGKVASISGTLDSQAVFENKNHALRPHEIRRIFGEEDPKGGKNDLFYLADKLTDTPDASPDIFVLCGKEDELYQENTKFVEQFQEKLPIKASFSQGNHDFYYWNQAIAELLDWLALDSL